MKVCHVITRMIVGGAQENTLLSAKGLAAAGHECVLLTGPSPGPEGELLARTGIPEGVEVVECPFLVREISPLNEIRAYRFMKKFFRERGFDLVHTHSSKAGILGRLAAHAAGVKKVVHTIHGLAFHPRERWWKNKLYIALEAKAAKVSDKIFAVAQAMIEQSLAVGIGKREQYQVVYSGMELERFLNAERENDLRRDLGIPEDAKVVGTVARLFPLKGYEELMKVIPSLAATRQDLYFLFVGNGSMMDEIRQWAAAQGLAERIRFAGLVPPHEVCRYVALMDIAVHLSLKEGLPRVAVQALAEGKAVVAYDLDGTPEVVRTGETGVLISPLDWQAAADAVCRLLDSPEELKRMGENGRALVRELFPWKRMSDILLEDYKQLLAEKAGKN